MRNKKLIPILLVLGILIIDQVSKIWIKLHFCIGEDVAIFPWFHIYFLENEGMAFGFSLGKDGGKLLLSVLRIAAIGLLIWYIAKLIRENCKTSILIAFSLILAGAIGNMIDSAFYGMIFSESFFSVAQFMPPEGGYAPFLHGMVVDMFYFPIIQGTYPAWFPVMGGQELVFFRPVFNIADSAISVGFIWFLISQMGNNKIGSSKSTEITESITKHEEDTPL